MLMPYYQGHIEISRTFSGWLSMKVYYLGIYAELSAELLLGQRWSHGQCHSQIFHGYVNTMHCICDCTFKNGSTGLKLN